MTTSYPIGTPGKPWSAAEKALWLSKQKKHRSYAKDVLTVIDRLRPRFDVDEYGRIDYPPEHYPLLALRSRNWRDNLPTILVTGGVHGYETSGVHGALRFADKHAAAYANRCNLLIAPCVCPWGYERIHRWTPHALDPNRSFKADTKVEECAALMKLVAPMKFLVHLDLHETTDTDESEFGPALAARDGKEHKPGTIPDGFYLVDDGEKPQPEFHNAIIAAVEKVTHIAPPDPQGNMIATPQVSPGVIRYSFKELGLCAGMTDAPYTTTTEVYPDSPRTNPEECNRAQAVAVCAAIDYALKQPRV
ncbi:MAG: succinylglutamate desuccinylase/aspartoacylase family protein [Planctomycetes bacterium]|nr:succinylglutamate desuccinylase/aspartoacylase family protein [Planctomycetota bacterium]